MCKIFKKKKVEEKTLKLIKNTYTDIRNIMRIKENVTKLFQTGKEVQQDGIPRSVLFVVLMDERACKTWEECKGTFIWYRQLKSVFNNELLYSDDLIMIEKEDKEEIKSKLETCTEALTQRGLKINTKKCEIIEIGTQEEQKDNIWKRTVKHIKYPDAVMERFCKRNKQSITNTNKIYMCGKE